MYSAVRSLLLGQHSFLSCFWRQDRFPAKRGLHLHVRLINITVWAHLRGCQQRRGRDVGGLGFFVGFFVGFVGALVGFLVGGLVGPVGALVGALVGAGAGHSRKSTLNHPPSTGLTCSAVLNEIEWLPALKLYEPKPVDVRLEKHTLGFAPQSFPVMPRLVVPSTVFASRTDHCESPVSYP